METESQSTAMSWYAAYTFPRHEKKVSDYLQLVGIETFLPTFTSPRRWKNRTTVELARPLFPSYVFARFNPLERVRVLEAAGVVDIVSSGGRPLPLPEREIQILKAGLTKTQAEPHPFLKVGDRVRMKSGALCGLEGILKRMKTDWRLIVSVDLLMQAISIEVDFVDVERISIGHPRSQLQPRMTFTRC